MKRTAVGLWSRLAAMGLGMLLALQPAAEATRAAGLGALPAASAALAASPAPDSAGCQWTEYPISGGRLQAQQLLYDDPFNTPIDNLSTGRLFTGRQSLHVASSGSADFDGDNKTDVIRTTVFSTDTLHWQYSSAGSSGWNDIGFGSSGLAAWAMRFGDFDGDHRTDVFAEIYNPPFNQWDYSSGGQDSFVSLHSTMGLYDLLALGDFNDDGVTDVFTTTFTGFVPGQTKYWGYWPGGGGSLVSLAHSDVDTHLLRFGDFDGDHTTDVLAADALGDGSIQWKYSSGGRLSYTDLATSTVPYADVLLGDFNGDNKTDVLTTLPQPDGGVEAVMWPGGLGPSVDLGHIAAPEPALRVGDFNGDGTDDLLALRCGMGRPLSFGPRQMLASSGYQGFLGRPLSGDVNGDGRQDVILASGCQNPDAFFDCATNYLQLGAALAQPGNNYTLVAPQTLGPNNVNFEQYLPLAGDFDGDGQTDVALVYTNASNVTVYLAHSNGNGTFSLGSPQSFAGNFSSYNPVVGDFNGDDKADLALASVCFFANFTCAGGDANHVFVLSSQGSSFTLGAERDLGPATGWNSFYGLTGDVNGDGKTDLVFVSTSGGANRVYTALSTGSANFSLSSLQNYGNSGWSDFNAQYALMADVNDDGKADLVWPSSSQSLAHTHNNEVAVGLADANGDGGFQVGSTINFGSLLPGPLSLADLNHDGKADLLWYLPPRANANADLNGDVTLYAAALSNGDGSFTSLGSGAVTSSRGLFYVPIAPTGGHLADGLTLVSQEQDLVSHALVMLHGTLRFGLYLPSVIR